MGSEKRKNASNPAGLMIKCVILSSLVSLPALLGLAIIMTSRGPLDSRRASLSFLLAGLTGIIVVIRRESPFSLGAIRGKWAVIEGLVFVVICWGIALYVALFGLN
jgi:hypothetical protein